jgi:hypothetical protein
MRVRFSNATGYQVLYSQYDDDNNNIQIYKSSYNERLSLYAVSGGKIVARFYVDNMTWNSNQWYHIAVVRKGTECLMFRDGVSLSVTKDTAFTTLPTLKAKPMIGGLNGGYNFKGWMDELRISKVARWTTAFTPPTTEYTEDSSIALLAHFMSSEYK